MQTPLRLLQHDRVAPHAEHTNRPPRIPHTRNLDHFDALDLVLVDKLRIPHLILRKALYIRNRLARQRLAQKLNLVPLNIFHDGDLELGEERERKFSNGVAEDGLLYQEDVTPRLFDALDEIEKVF